MNHQVGIDPDDVRVLFVEDDASVAQMYRLKLELDGYTVDVAGDGLAALEKARSSPPDIIFLDIRLPKLDGLAVLEAGGEPREGKAHQGGRRDGEDDGDRGKQKEVPSVDAEGLVEQVADFQGAKAKWNRYAHFLVVKRCTNGDGN